MEKLQSTDLHSIEKFHRFVYDDNLTTGSGYVESAYEFYIKGKPRLAEANFKLRVTHLSWVRKSKRRCRSPSSVAMRNICG